MGTGQAGSSTSAAASKPRRKSSLAVEPWLRSLVVAAVAWAVSLTTLPSVHWPTNADPSSTAVLYTPYGPELRLLEALLLTLAFSLVEILIRRLWWSRHASVAMAALIAMSLYFIAACGQAMD